MFVHFGLQLAARPGNLQHRLFGLERENAETTAAAQHRRKKHIFQRPLRTSTVFCVLPDRPPESGGGSTKRTSQYSFGDVSRSRLVVCLIRLWRQVVFIHLVPSVLNAAQNRKDIAARPAVLGAELAGEALAVSEAPVDDQAVQSLAVDSPTVPKSVGFRHLHGPYGINTGLNGLDHVACIARPQLRFGVWRSGGRHRSHLRVAKSAVKGLPAQSSVRA